MRNYKAVVVDIRGFFKAAGIVALSVAVTLMAVYTINKRFSGEGAAERVLKDNVPIIESGLNSGGVGKYIRSLGEKTEKTILGYIPTDVESVLSGAIPMYAEISKRGRLLVKRADNDKGTEEEYDNRYEGSKGEKQETPNISEDKKAEIRSIDARQKPADGNMVAIGNETSYALDINSMLSGKPRINMGASGPKVLITHTHATEAYASEGAKFYDVTASDRSDDVNKNVVAVGKRLTDILNSKGIETVHDTILHDKPSFNGSYANSLSTAEEYIKKYPSIQVVFDIHRDSIVYDDKTKAKTVTNIDGASVAQLMFVVGTDEKGLDHPTWRDNLTAAVQMQTVIAKKYPGLMRHINLRKERFNGHTTGASMIIEVGTCGNSLNEALCGVEKAGNCIADYLNSL